MHKLWMRIFRPRKKVIEDLLIPGLSLQHSELLGKLSMIDRSVSNSVDELKKIEFSMSSLASAMLAQTKQAVTAFDEMKRYFTAEREALEREAHIEKPQPTEADLRF